MEGTKLPEQRSRGFLGKVANFIQWIVFTFVALFALLVATELRKTSVPGAPVPLLYITVAVTTLIALIHLPPVFTRLPRKSGWAAYGSIVAVMILFGVYLDQMQPAWERTAEGAKELAARAEADHHASAEQAKREEDARMRADMEETKKQLEEIHAKLERCFTTFGHRLPALEEPVKASLHNADAFEHVETVLIVPDEQRNDVEMKFRAENGFGAIRTATVRAQLIADDCSVQNIGEPQID